VDGCAARVDERAAKDGRSGPAIPLMCVLVSTVLTHAVYGVGSAACDDAIAGNH
jgi:hypothetical protein